MKVIAEIDDPVIARKILEHLGLAAEELELTPARGPPQEAKVTLARKIAASTLEMWKRGEPSRPRSLT